MPASDAEGSAADAAPLVSVIMNVRNGATTLRAAIDSVLAQTFADWELVLWDDGSTDGSVALAAALAATDTRLRCLASPAPSHLGAARALAMAAARGQWLAFLDQDDIWLPQKLERQLARTAPGVDLVYCRTVMVREDGRRRDFDHRHEHEALPEGDIFEALVAQSCFICMSSAVLRRQAVLRAQALPDWVQVAPDYWLFLALARAGQARAVPEPLCLYRLHGASMTAASLGRIQDEAVAMLQHWQQHIPAPLLRQRLRVHHSVAAYVQLRTPGQRASGARRLLQHGSLPYVLSRPWARAWRWLRRHWQAPQWQQQAEHSGLVLPRTLQRSPAQAARSA